MKQSLKIPLEIYKLYPKLDPNSWEITKNNPKFMNQMTPLCIDCYLQLIKSEKWKSGVNDLEFLKTEDIQENFEHLKKNSSNFFFNRVTTSQMANLT